MGANFKHGGLVLIGNQKRWQEELFVAGPLYSLIPDDHILNLVDKVLDPSWLRDEVKDLYCCDNGRPGIDPDATMTTSCNTFRMEPCYKQHSAVNDSCGVCGLTFCAILLLFLESVDAETV